MRTVTILRPDIAVKRDENPPWLLAAHTAAILRFGTPWVEDWAERLVAHYYVAVPVTETYGHYKVRDLLPPEQLAVLATYVKRADKKGRNRANGNRH